MRRFYDMGFNIEATAGTAAFLKNHGIRTRVRGKLSEGSHEIPGLHPFRAMSAMSSTPGPCGLGAHAQDGAAIRRCAVENGVTIFTSLDTVRVLLDVLEETTTGDLHHRRENKEGAPWNSGTIQSQKIQSWPPGHTRMVPDGGHLATSPGPGQFVNIRLEGCFLRRPISVCRLGRADSLTLDLQDRGRGHGAA